MVHMNPDIHKLLLKCIYKYKRIYTYVCVYVYTHTEKERENNNYVYLRIIYELVARVVCVCKNVCSK